MSYEATITSKGQITIPKKVRERLQLTEGQKVLFRFDEDGGVRMIGVPNDPMDRLKTARKRAAPFEIDAAELLERERREWSRHA